MARGVYRGNAEDYSANQCSGTSKECGILPTYDQTTAWPVYTDYGEAVRDSSSGQRSKISARRIVLRSFCYKMAYDELKGILCPNSILARGIRQGFISEGGCFGQTPLSHDEQVIISGCQVDIVHIDYSRGDLHLLAQACHRFLRAHVLLVPPMIRSTKRQ